MSTRARRFPFPRRRWAAACLTLTVAVLGLAAPAAATAQRLATSAGEPPVPRLDHVFVIMEENNGFHDVIPNKAAPNLDYLAKTFGVATDFFGVSPDSSESNYVGLLGGSVYGVTSDDAYWKNKINEPSVISQLDHAGISWKAYMQGIPHPGYQGMCYPKCDGAPDSDPLYVSKHDGIQNFTTSWNPYDWSREVPITQLSQDLATGDVPRFSYIVPDECHDMHGDPPYCLDSGNIRDPENQHLVAVGDAYLGQLVSEITHASFWARGNNAIAITYDNGDNNAGCCDAVPGGGKIALIVITSHGPRGVTDSTPGNQYSLLSSIQHALGVGCLAFTCDTKHVVPLGKLFAITGSKAIATKALPELNWPTPTPSQPKEPLSESPTSPPASGGWSVQQAQLLGTNDNSGGAIAGSSPDDVWMVGDYLPDKPLPQSNSDVTLSFAEHWNGKKWTVVRTPNTGPNFNSFYGLTAKDGYAWAVGEHLNAAYRDRTLLEVWNGKQWSIANTPNPGSLRDMLFGASALSTSNVWAVGNQESADGNFETLAEHWNARPRHQRQPAVRGRRGVRGQRVGGRPAVLRGGPGPGSGRALERARLVDSSAAGLGVRTGDARRRDRLRRPGLGGRRGRQPGRRTAADRAPRERALVHRAPAGASRRVQLGQPLRHDRSPGLRLGGGHLRGPGDRQQRRPGAPRHRRHVDHRQRAERRRQGLQRHPRWHHRHRRAAVAGGHVHHCNQQRDTAYRAPLSARPPAELASPRARADGRRIFGGRPPAGVVR
jgi:hypothetical protein